MANHICQFCKEYFKTTDKLQAHKNKQECIERMSRICRYCQRDFTENISMRQVDFEKHEEKCKRFHFYIDATLQICKFCNKKFVKERPGDLFSHLEKYHPKRLKSSLPNVECNYCKLLIPEVRILEHERECENLVKLVQYTTCLLCQQKFKSRIVAYKHISINHPKEMNQIQNHVIFEQPTINEMKVENCRFCNKPQDGENLISHEKKCQKFAQHIDENNSCKFCGHQFDTRISAERHVAQYHLKYNNEKKKPEKKPEKNPKDKKNIIGQCEVYIHDCITCQDKPCLMAQNANADQIRYLMDEREKLENESIEKDSKEEIALAMSNPLQSHNQSFHLNFAEDIDDINQNELEQAPFNDIIADYNDQEDSENELQDLTEAQLINDVEKVYLDDTANDETAKPDLKLNLPNLVYIYKTTAKRMPIIRAHYEAFSDFLLEQIMELPIEESDKIKIDWHGFGLQRGVIGCLDPHTAQVVINIIDNFSFEQEKFRGWLRRKEHVDVVQISE